MNDKNDKAAKLAEIVQQFAKAGVRLSDKEPQQPVERIGFHGSLSKPEKS